MTTKWFNKTNAQVAEYVITITNDGNIALWLPSMCATSSRRALST